MLDLNATQGEMIDVVSLIAECNDPKDDKFLNLAIDGRADVIISRDPDLLVLHPFRNILVLNPSDFILWINDHDIAS
jgi:predicted nucleic acid-binding protein